MTLQRAQAFEIGGHHAHAEMSPPVPRTGMPGVQMTVVDEFHGLWPERRSQRSFNPGSAIGRGEIHDYLESGARSEASGGSLDTNQKVRTRVKMKDTPIMAALNFIQKGVSK